MDNPSRPAPAMTDDLRRAFSKLQWSRDNGVVDVALSFSDIDALLALYPALPPSPAEAVGHTAPIEDENAPEGKFHPLEGLHRNAGGVDAAADEYERAYWAERAQDNADADQRRGALQPVGYYVRKIIGAMQSTGRVAHAAPATKADSESMGREVMALVDVVQGNAYTLKTVIKNSPEWFAASTKILNARKSIASLLCGAQSDAQSSQDRRPDSPNDSVDVAPQGEPAP